MKRWKLVSALPDATPHVLLHPARVFLITHTAHIVATIVQNKHVESCIFSIFVKSKRGTATGCVNGQWLSVAGTGPEN